MKRHQAINQAAFAEKWRRVLDTHQPNGVRAEFERDRWTSRRLLVVDACMLRPDQDSGSLRMQGLLEIATSLGCKVTFIADNLEYQQPYVGALQDSGIEVLFHPYALDRRAVDETRREFDVVMLSRHYVAARHIDTVRRYAPHARVVFDTVDLHFARSGWRRSTAAASRRSPRVRSAPKLALITSRAVVVSEAEQQMLGSLAGFAHRARLQRARYPRQWHRSAGADLVFIGGFRHPPNVDAVLWYARDVLPHVRRSLPGVTTYVIGGDVPASVEALAADDSSCSVTSPTLRRLCGCRVSDAVALRAGVKGRSISP